MSKVKGFLLGLSLACLSGVSEAKKDDLGTWFNDLPDFYQDFVHEFYIYARNPAHGQDRILRRDVTLIDYLEAIESGLSTREIAEYLGSVELSNPKAGSDESIREYHQRMSTEHLRSWGSFRIHSHYANPFSQNHLDIPLKRVFEWDLDSGAVSLVSKKKPRAKSLDDWLETERAEYEKRAGGPARKLTFEEAFDIAAAVVFQWQATFSSIYGSPSSEYFFAGPEDIHWDLDLVSLVAYWQNEAKNSRFNSLSSLQRRKHSVERVTEIFVRATDFVYSLVREAGHIIEDPSRLNFDGHGPLRTLTGRYSVRTIEDFANYIHDRSVSRFPKTTKLSSGK